jgi:hypothetical protein
VNFVAATEVELHGWCCWLLLLVASCRGIPEWGAARAAGAHQERVSMQHAAGAASNTRQTAAGCCSVSADSEQSTHRQQQARCTPEKVLNLGVRIEHKGAEQASSMWGCRAACDLQQQLQQLWLPHVGLCSGYE